MKSLGVAPGQLNAQPPRLIKYAIAVQLLMGADWHSWNCLIHNFLIIHPPPPQKNKQTTNKEKMIAVLNFSASSNKNLSEEERAKEKENGIGKYLVSGEVCVLNMV